MSITTETYTALNAAYDYFNKAIWDGKLPECLITLAHQRSAYGYFRPQPFSERKAKKPSKAKTPPKVKKTDEISLNPFHFEGRSDAQIFSTLVHEQAHLWQQHFGKPKKTHHDKEWANKMEAIGLMPSSTGQPGGKRTGKRVSHYIIEGGKFDQAMKKCKIILDWQGNLDARAVVGSRRTKFTCPSCDANAYGKSSLNISCNDCKEDMVPA